MGQTGQENPCPSSLDNRRVGFMPAQRLGCATAKAGLAPSHAAAHFYGYIFIFPLVQQAIHDSYGEYMKKA